MPKLYLTLLFITSSLVLYAQPANDECAGAVVLPDQLEYCSAVGEFTNVGATRSFEAPGDYAVCIDERDQVRDVWFTFIARRNSANIIVTGDVNPGPGGTINAPQFAFYAGGCGALGEELGCRSPVVDPRSGQLPNGGNIIFNELITGQTYRIQVSARNGNQGTFQLCVNQFDQVVEPSSDCGTGVILCDKSPFAVDFLQGSGDVNDRLLADVECNLRPTEENSAWYKWTCDRAGTLGFTITPSGVAFNEDIDFVVYELANGLDDCGSRTVLRQMFSGETNGKDDLDNRPCLRATGLRESSNDVAENCGCDDGDDNFVSAIDMVAGRSYALVIMNFSGSGDGFAIEFGGTGTFVGPEADFTVSTSEICVGDALVFEDRSTSLDAIVSREWDFGPTATPRLASGPGPHSIVFGAPGSPNVQLIIETERECREIANLQEVTVTCCEGQFSATGSPSDLTCPNDMSGAIDLTASSGFSPTTLSYVWSNGETTEDIATLDVGDFTVTVSDESGCTEAFSFVVGGPDPFTFDTLVTQPDCGGATNGALEFTVTGGGEGPYTYSFDGAPFSDDNQLGSIASRTVNVRARDANDCPINQDIEVRELELGLVQGEEIFTEPVCAGDENAAITIRIANGTPSYQYDFGLGDGFQGDNVRTGLPPGAYSVTARDATGCLGIFPIEITEPPVINFSVDGTDITCFGDGDGTLDTLASGGRPGYGVNFLDGTAFTEETSQGLEAGNYTVLLTDTNGCETRDAFLVTEPDEIIPRIVATNDLLCFGEPTGGFALAATGGSPGYTYSADGENFQLDSVLTSLLAGEYTLYVQDANGCTDSLAGSLTEPDEFVVDPGRETTILLGFDTILRATSNYVPVEYFWGPDSLLCLDPLCTRVRAAPVRTTDYVVVGVNAAGCTDSVGLRVNVLIEKPLYVPSGFSPNGDGRNDGFTVFAGRAVREVTSLRVYHRWGGLVFENENFLPNDPSLGWDGNVDGRAINPAVFVYRAVVEFVNGDVETLSGDVTLTR
ncbi:T9SS type B sorting domain-containing protein [Neolewinella antarctica]|uniref:Gliding motility-associated-like protein n=1 Tax=Neolewinella antarctica TaxID=442734 RepID=A0ABX0XE37_9BACT|nr:gliding motility-associated C-terminal domain-containing protein [Neolewinella antarctica]NJC27063.1 gliding motility-associated-like protein [Neolewinella antarctica]